jgi:anthranilate synthase component 1
MIPHILKINSDLETPVSNFLKLCENQDKLFLLESAEQEASFGRYSFIGLGAKDELFLNSDGQLFDSKGPIKIDSNKSPLSYLLNWLLKYKSNFQYTEDLPIFTGGAVGYVGYNYVKYIENVPVKKTQFPDFYFIIPEHLIIFDHVKNQIFVISENPEKIIEKLNKPYEIKKNETIQMITEPVSNFTRENFYKAVEKAKKYIIEGDIFQVVLSQAFRFKTTIHPFSIYRALRMINPSPYMFYLKFGNITILGSSPELMVKMNNNKVTLKPIAGTRRRGNTIDEDIKLEKELLNDEKERAEHIMLVDLGRNDLGRVCKKGTVKVEENMKVERFSHVMHLVSCITGELRDDKNAIDLFEATFPAGTVTGAPKIRAMEIINELEPTGRGPYAGAVLYFSFPNENNIINMDSGIMIRSFFFYNNEGLLQAGAGIVYDSSPENEYKETINKLNALFKSLEIAKNL